MQPFLAWSPCTTDALPLCRMPLREPASWRATSHATRRAASCRAASEPTMSASSTPALNVLPEPSASASSSAQSAPSDCEIFISYRHEPDEELANALQKQLE